MRDKLLRRYDCHEDSFQNKILYFVIASILSVTLIVTVVMTLVFVYYVSETARQLAWEQEKSIAKSLDQQIFSICQLGEMAGDNKVLLKDMDNRSEEIPDYQAYMNQISMELLNISRMNQLIDFAAVLKLEDQSIKYVGYGWRADKNRLYETLMEDYKQADQVDGKEVYVHLSEQIFSEDGYSVNLYFPVFDSEMVYQKTGIICISILERDLFSLFRDCGISIFSETYIVDEQGLIVACENPELVGQICSLKSDSPGNFILKSNMEACDWCIVSRISLPELLKGYVGYFVLILAAALILCGLAVVVCTRSMTRMNSSFRELQYQMNLVAGGNMDTRMTEEYKEEEFRQMAHCFNKMVDAVNRLMERVKEEQQQVKQIELEALQAQIKPHFLYNTLESIHWQAVMDGNEKISELVKALAQYYRLCLSKGADIVTLSQELEHIQNYLIIQNIRYKTSWSAMLIFRRCCCRQPFPR